VTDLIDVGGGARLAFDDLGSGRPVVLIHGVSMSRRFFERNVPGLAERFRVVNVDLRGHGESPPHEGGHTVAQYARDLHALIAQLGLDGVVLVGWSMGTKVAWELIRQFGTDGLAVMAEYVPETSADATCILLDQSLRDFRGLVGSYELPTLCTWGRDEKSMPVAAGEWLAANQPADLHVFEGSGHCPMWEEPELWNRVVGDWIAAR
jgi:pimeloyl-ACP methyl ester carboxylesterase